MNVCMTVNIFPLQNRVTWPVREDDEQAVVEESDDK